ncbi:OpgC protein [Aquimixticola soesokkakensis]|uniref:OpgC protein n=1 Tax=Aquimixticola soesokkakensis TaxID=1519096 RepID=A0A1Y5RU30_9RHOB|nr:OpgC domain-containing protein [Aquimixticola soesokkakensis]SLN25471.1 OpgC protein [Aquimixticola soesokkakensis]
MTKTPLVSRRDPRLDFFRGLALVMIFINHVPGNPLEVLTNRNFGFSDAAEGFVFMSGMAAGLAYPGAFATLPLWRAVAKCWGRAWTLYSVHLVITAICLAIMLAAALWFDAPKMWTINNVGPWMRAPVQSTIGIATLGHQFGYLNILPMYAALLILAPLMILIARKSLPVMLGLSFVLWVCAGEFRLNLPAYPNPGGWFFNPFAWQFLFAIGLASGMCLKEGRRLVPLRAWAVWGALALLVFCALWVQVGAIATLGRGGLRWLGDLGAPFYLVNFDKTFLAAPRLLHILLLVYFLSSQPWVTRLSASRWVAPVSLMGRFGLPVFALGTVLSILGQSWKAALVNDTWVFDTSYVFAGLIVQMGFARIKWQLSQPVSR